MKTQRGFCLLFGLMMIISSCKTTQALKSPTPPLSLSQKIDVLIQSYDPAAHVGIQIVSLKDKKILYERNENTMFIPGSTAKIYTLAAALHYLGPSYRFETEGYIEERNGHRAKNIYLKGSGDPSLSASDLLKIATVLKQYGIREITGDIVIDNTAFDSVSRGKGWMWDDLDRGFAAPITALNVDYNRLVVFVSPGDKEGDKVKVNYEPYSHFVKAEVLATTGKANSKNTLAFDVGANPDPHGLNLHQTIRLTGSVPKNAARDYTSFSIKDPSAYAGYLFKEALSSLHIPFKGSIRQGKTPENAQFFTRVLSRPLSEAVVDFGKISNNNGTETLLKTIGLKTKGAPGTFDSGLVAVRSFLSDTAKVKLKGFSLSDGSGLSTYNKTSAAQMNQLLGYMWGNFRIGSEFVSSLPIAGEDGTLPKRWKDSALKSGVRAKTGTMQSVNSIAGYFSDPAGEVYSFAILVNGFSTGAAACRQLSHDILSLFYNEPQEQK